jgi:hypothetical protein
MYRGCFWWLSLFFCVYPSDLDSYIHSYHIIPVSDSCLTIPHNLSTLFHIAPQPHPTNLPPPLPNRPQRPPLRNHQNQPTPRNKAHNREEIPRTLHKPLLVPPQPRINIPTYRALVDVPRRQHRVQQPGAEGQDDVYEREGDEGEGAGVRESVGGYEAWV